MCASGPQNFGVNVPMPDCLCMLKHARVVPQQSHSGALGKSLEIQQPGRQCWLLADLCLHQAALTLSPH